MTTVRSNTDGGWRAFAALAAGLRPLDQPRRGEVRSILLLWLGVAAVLGGSRWLAPASTEAWMPAVLATATLPARSLGAALWQSLVQSPRLEGVARAAWPYRDLLSKSAWLGGLVALSAVGGYRPSLLPTGIASLAAIGSITAGSGFFFLATSRARRRFGRSVAGSAVPAPSKLRWCVATVWGNAALEELLFRGLLLAALLDLLGQGRTAAWVAVTAGAGLFGLGHLSGARPSRVGGAAAMAGAGLILGWSTLVTGSLLPAIALHGGVLGALGTRGWLAAHAARRERAGPGGIPEFIVEGRRQMLFADLEGTVLTPLCRRGSRLDVLLDELRPVDGSTVVTSWSHLVERLRREDGAVHVDASAPPGIRSLAAADVLLALPTHGARALGSGGWSAASRAAVTDALHQSLGPRRASNLPPSPSSTQSRGAPAPRTESRMEAMT